MYAYTSKIDKIHKASDIKRKEARVPIIAKIKILHQIIFNALRIFHTLKSSGFPLNQKLKNIA